MLEERYGKFTILKLKLSRLSYTAVEYFRFSIVTSISKYDLSKSYMMQVLHIFFFVIQNTIDLHVHARPGGLTGTCNGQDPIEQLLYSNKGPIHDEWEISNDDVIVEQLVGKGAFGEVYKGVIRGPLENPKISAVLRQAIGVPVAIKLLKRKFSTSRMRHIDFLRRSIDFH